MQPSKTHFYLLWWSEHLDPLFIWTLDFYPQSSDDLPKIWTSAPPALIATSYQPSTRMRGLCILFRWHCSSLRSQSLFPFSRPVFLKLKHTSESPVRIIKDCQRHPPPNSFDLIEAPRMHVANKFPVGADAAVQGPCFKSHCCGPILLLYISFPLLPSLHWANSLPFCGLKPIRLLWLNLGQNRHHWIGHKTYCPTKIQGHPQI